MAWNYSKEEEENSSKVNSRLFKLTCKIVIILLCKIYLKKTVMVIVIVL